LEVFYLKFFQAGLVNKVGESLINRDLMRLSEQVAIGLAELEKMLGKPLNLLGFRVFAILKNVVFILGRRTH
jgi:hypothetical protein